MNDKNELINFMKPFTINFDLENGLSKKTSTVKRNLSDMKGMFYDDEILKQMIKDKDSLVYEYYKLGFPEDVGDIAFGTSIVYPGKVGKEYYMTKGHFHNKLDTAEVYLCLQGEGYMLQENPEGEWSAKKIDKGEAVYCPKRFSHRSINVGDEPLITFFAFRADAGHDYGTIQSKGYRKLIIEENGNPKIVDNPNWK